MFKQIAYVSLGFVLAGCAGGASINASKNLDQDYQNGLYKNAAISIEQDLGLVEEAGFKIVDVKAGNVLFHLNAGETWRLSGNHERARAHFDGVETLLKVEDLEGIGTKTGETIGSVLVNDKVRSYNPAASERILTNFYQGLSFWADKNTNNALVEFKKADERTRLALQAYRKEIDKANKEARAEGQAVSQNISNGYAGNQIGRRFPEIDTWKVYDNFVNPSVAYMNALLLSTGQGSDIESAKDLMKRVRGMVGKNPVIDSDFNNLMQSNSLTSGGDYVWVVAETGLGPVLTEEKFDLPWPTGGTAIVVSMALPKLVERNVDVDMSGIALNGRPVRLYPLSDMSVVMQTEFKKRWPAVVSRALVSTVTKAVIQKQAADENPLLGFAATIYSVATTGADTRSWKMTPKRWRVAKVKLNGDAKISLPYGLEGQSVDLDIPGGKSSVVYIKQPSINAKPYVALLPM
ncbi:MAG: COG3014 family protein [Parvibaculales bacterium]